MIFSGEKEGRSGIIHHMSNTSNTRDPLGMGQKPSLLKELHQSHGHSQDVAANRALSPCRMAAVVVLYAWNPI